MCEGQGEGKSFIGILFKQNAHMFFFVQTQCVRKILSPNRGLYDAFIDVFCKKSWILLKNTWKKQATHRSESCPNTTAPNVTPRKKYVARA